MVGGCAVCIGGVVESVLHWEGVVGGCAVCIGGMVESVLHLPLVLPCGPAICNMITPCTKQRWP